MAEIAGLKLITPSSVAGSGVSLTGAKVVFTAATSVSVNGVFSATHDNYLVVVRGSVATSGSAITHRWRVGGSDATGANYARQYLEAEGTNVTSSRQTGATSSPWSSFNNTLPQGFHTYLYGPALAQPTAYRSISVQSYNDATITEYAGTHSLSTAYDGFTLYPSANNITGALTIYGLSQ